MRVRARGPPVTHWSSIRAHRWDGRHPIPLTGEVLPGATIDLSVILMTPSAAGTYRGNWRLSNELGQAFALADGEAFHVQLIVTP